MREGGGGGVTQQKGHGFLTFVGASRENSKMNGVCAFEGSPAQAGKLAGLTRLLSKNWCNLPYECATKPSFLDAREFRMKRVALCYKQALVTSRDKRAGAPWA